ncbi:MAG: hypothetical protein ABI831_13290 [Betaproteobacteria bacterium]
MNCGPTCPQNYAIGAGVTLTAIPAGGSTLTGWLGPCTGTGNCVVSISGATVVKAAFAPDAAVVRILDLDGNQQYDVLTDGLPLIRHLFGLTGSSPAGVTPAIQLRRAKPLAPATLD